MAEPRPPVRPVTLAVAVVEWVLLAVTQHLVSEVPAETVLLLVCKQVLQ
jgi:hypothetical protein